MPTGYTAAIADGITFDRFAMNCARAFGACVTLRDEPGGGELIPERFEPSDYHLKQLEIAQARLAELEALSLEDAELRCRADYQQAEVSRLERLQKNKDQMAAYASMLDQVNAWVPPSDEHNGLQDFMRSQIEQSIKFDDMVDYYEKPTVLQTGEEWLEAQKLSTLKNIDYHRTEHAKEVERTEQRNEWVRLLRDSLRQAHGGDA